MLHRIEMAEYMVTSLAFPARRAIPLQSLRAFALVMMLLLASTSFAQESTRRNVLFIAVDDLTCSLGCYGDAMAQTPNIDQLAARGTRFDHAYCQLPLCNPSRASVLTGLRPDALGVYDLERHFRDNIADVITLPQRFKQQGWFVARVGKLFHYNVPNGIGTDGLDDPSSWEVVVNPKGRDTMEEELITNAEPHRPISGALSWLAAEGTDAEQTDGMVASEAIRLMRNHKSERFFLGVGFFRPHTPYVAPKKYFEKFPIENFKLPYAPDNDRDDIPPAAFAHNCPVPNYRLPKETCLRALQAYYASVSFVDAQIGRVLDELRKLGLEDSTVVVLWSDHGYHLGEHLGIWQKRCLFEESARAPLVVYLPGASGNGRPCARVVEFVDLCPTLMELCELPADKTLPGKSLAPLLEAPDRTWPSFAVTQVLRPGDGQPVMGRSIRTERWRFTQWNAGAAGSELYDHINDPHEFVNLADRDEFASVKSELLRELDSRAVGVPTDLSFNPERL